MKSKDCDHNPAKSDVYHALLFRGGLEIGLGSHDCNSSCNIVDVPLAYDTGLCLTSVVFCGERNFTDNFL